MFFNNKLPDLNKAIATCDHCGFKSVYYIPLLEIDDAEMEKLSDLINRRKREHEHDTN